jgi:hypothetical protein
MVPMQRARNFKMSVALEKVVVREAVKLLESPGAWVEERSWGYIGDEAISGELGDAILRASAFTRWCPWMALYAAAHRLESDVKRARNMADAAVVYVTKEFEITSTELHLWHARVGREKGLAAFRSLAA